MRADLYLFEKGYARSREDARRSILAGLVKIDGKMVSKPSAQIDEEFSGNVEFSRSVPYVGRGGLKLEAALDRFKIDVSGLCCVDVGASTGGFTDCLLSRGAAKVYAVDSGHGQLAPELRSDPRVVPMEGVNAKFITPADFPDAPHLAVMDVSFISQTQLHAAVFGILKPGGMFVSLIKPQFECGKGNIGKGGVVRDRKKRETAVGKVLDSARLTGFTVAGRFESPLTGGDGNVEYLALFVKGGNI